MVAAIPATPRPPRAPPLRMRRRRRATRALSVTRAGDRAERDPVAGHPAVSVTPGQGGAG
jgi:hypothetical protein